MIKVRVLSRTAVTVGHRQLLPDETHDVAGGDLNAAVVLYGAAAFKILGGAPAVAPDPDGSGATGRPSPVDAGADTGDATESVATSDEAARAVQRNRRKG